MYTLIMWALAANFRKYSNPIYHFSIFGIILYVYS